MDLVVTKLWDDNEIMGRFYLQSCNLHIEQFFTNDEKDKVYNTIFNIMNKILAMNYHMKNYLQLEKNLYSKAQRKFKKDANQNIQAYELIFELEAFLYQCKSSLDIMVKILTPIVGPRVIKTQTFGNKGETTIKGLEQYKHNKSVNINAINAINRLIVLIKENQDAWLKIIIEMRDKLCHYTGLCNYLFIPKRLPNGDIVPEKPKIIQLMATDKFLNLVYNNNIQFQQDFFCMALSIRFPTGIDLMEANQMQILQDHNNHEAAKYIKYSVGMRSAITP